MRQTKEAIGDESFKVFLLAISRTVEAIAENFSDGYSKGIKLHDEVRRFEAEIIRCALRQTGGRIRRAARLLDIKAPTLVAKMKRYSINSHDKDKGNSSSLLAAETYGHLNRR
jgi:DNA-binding NtrC family response regulator